MEEKILLAIEGLKENFNQKMGSLSSKVDTISGEERNIDIIKNLVLNP